MKRFMLNLKNLGTVLLLLLSIPAILFVDFITLWSLLGGVEILVLCIIFLSCAVFITTKYCPNRTDAWRIHVVVVCASTWLLAIWYGSDIVQAHLLNIFLSVLLPLSAIMMFAKGTPFRLKVCVIMLFVGIGLYNVYHNDIIDPTIWWCGDGYHAYPWAQNYRLFWVKKIVYMTICKASVLSLFLLAGYKGCKLIKKKISCHNHGYMKWKFGEDFQKAIDNGQLSLTNEYPCVPDEQYTSPKCIGKKCGLALPHFSIKECRETLQDFTGDYLGTANIEFDDPIDDNIVLQIEKDMKCVQSKWVKGKDDNEYICHLLEINLDKGQDKFWRLVLRKGSSVGEISYGRV